ncbi:MAG: hypothetical protein JW829_08990, partial [Pirellulales bacterium]|nr:hypothetical protein [Pirellulales bacterium]
MMTHNTPAYSRARMLAILVAYLLAACGQEKTLSNEAEPSVPHKQSSPFGVCPPFYLRDESGNVINPVVGTNTDQPYSPKQTCGACHDYEKITKGFHFTQGMGEEPTAEQAARCLWVSMPGNFGGNWCSPAPLYSYLSPKHNDTAITMDMTPFTFITKGCGSCHPGGGPVEFDRDGKRYDHWMSDPQSGFSPGADNNLDGDYHQAHWSSTGVLEADCLLCHMPNYDLTQRNKQLSAWNFRWAATVGSKFATVKGSIKSEKPVEVIYHKKLFNPDGTIEPQIVREPRNEACLGCHAQPGWKKRGANFSTRTDVHLRAGLKCVDCHPAGSSATDPRIAGKEEHQFGKGDDPGGLVRNDLDDTVVNCTDCHNTGRMGAPVAKHLWLPPLHLDAIACQTCHIPERLVMPIEVQTSDVFNTAPKIPSPGKRLWTFYGPNGQFRNHYGYLEMMGYDDKPTESFRPKLVRYKGKIYPANRIHSAWPGIQLDDETAFMQPKMSTLYKMWTAHQTDATKYSKLSKITDDNGDSVPEVNRPEEIDALIQSVAQVLADTDYPMAGKRVVWVMDDRVYISGTEFRTLDMHPWEASTYANVHKYNHDVLPANAALGVNGCTDCHHPKSNFFFASHVKYLFDENAQPVMQPQYHFLELSLPAVKIGAWREVYLKPIIYGLIVVLCLAIIAAAGGVALRWVFAPRPVPATLRPLPLVVAILTGAGAVMLFWRPQLIEYMLPTRFWLDSNHFLIAVAILIVGLVALLWELKSRVSQIHSKGSWLKSLIGGQLAISLFLACITGMLIFLKIPGLDSVTRYAYTIFDLALALVVFGAIIVMLRYAIRMAIVPSPPLITGQL